MKYSLALFSILSIVLADATSDQLMALGFPACAIPCVLEGNQAAMTKNGCGVADGACQCGAGYQTAQNAVLSCLMQSKTPCSDKDQPKIAEAGAKLCAAYKSADATPSSNSTAAKTSAPAATPSATKNAAASEKAFAAGAMGLVGLAGLAFAL